nr:hypothetical protein [Alkalibaculum sporogenes]
MKGNNTSPWKEITAILEEDIIKKRGLFHFIRGKTTNTEDKTYVKPYSLQSSGAFSSMIFSDCLIMMPEELTHVKSGEEIKIQMLN